jgi:DNA repair protein SbcC/Rad50
MIPLKLTLHNFLCYRDPAPLDFSGLHLACLSGNNGHGKTALLDAMTWALWGRARSNQADDLIHLGQVDMWVDFEFALGPSRYRAVRSRERKGRSGKSDLQLQVWQPGQENGEWRPITEPTIRETEQRIVDLLRMDYDTFINSAFLMQGRADEFTIKPPNQRKQILADILGLGAYDEFETRAKEQARQTKDQATRLETHLKSIDAELALEPQIQVELETALNQSDALTGQLRSAEQLHQALRAERQDLQAQSRSLDDLQSRLKRTERDLTEAEGQLTLARQRLATDQAILESQAEIESGFLALKQAEQLDQAWNDRLKRHVELQARHSRLEQTVSQARSQLEAQRQIGAAETAQYRTTAERLPALRQHLAEAEAELARLAQEEARQAQMQHQLQTLKETRAALQAENAGLKGEMDKIKERLDLLAEAEAACPVCGRPLGADEQGRVLADFQQQGQVLGDTHRQNTARLREIQVEQQAAQAELTEVEQALRQKSHWQRQEAQIEAQLTAAQRAEVELAAAQATLEQIEARLAMHDYAIEAQQALAELDRQLTELGYDSAAHQKTRDDVVGYKPFETRNGQLQTAQARAQELQARIEQLNASLERWQETLAADRSRRDELTAVVARLPQSERALSQQSTEVERLERAANDARQRLGAARQKLDACRMQAARRQNVAGDLAAVLDRQSVFEELQAAFGKKGVQAMIIEAAIPEIENEANRLLNRMTDGRMAVRMETQRETKSSQELRETLDIILSDELGSRDYSLYSGGEAFRANFAIRIALSKLLARRAGAALQTLIVDEGFGTQDSQGRERLVQAITSIQDDFERILVITHIDELKDLFPARIDVVKTEMGSQISIGM